MTQEQIELLDQLMLTGRATRTSEILEGRAKMTFSSTTTEEQIAVEAELNALKDSLPQHFFHTFSVKLLSRVLKKFQYGDKAYTFATIEEAEKFILSRPSVLTDAMITESTKLQKEISDLIKPENIEKNFSTTPSTGSEQK